MLALWIGTFLVEMILHSLPLVWQYRRVVTPLLGVVIFVSTLGLMRDVGPVVGVVLAFFGMYRLGNILRIIKARMHQHYLKRAFGRTSLWLFIIHSVVIMVIVLPIMLVPHGFWQFIMILQLLVAISFLMITTINIIKLHFKTPQKYLTDNELPTITVAIPARNETDQLQSCLTSILLNDYPKMEIIVLDDCSQRPTTQIIKSFAHDGVRFVKGLEPGERWLAKNQAYQKLYQEATGDLILFCGVDARFGSQSIRAMVNLMYDRNKSMLSVLPTRTGQSPSAAFIQPVKYWWLLALPRRLFNRPAVLSTCWMIGRTDLKKLGGFLAVSHSILPENYFARELIKTDQYSFVRSSSELEVQTTKNIHEQYASDIRTHYPIARRRPENVLIMSLFIIIFFLGPFVGLAVALWLKTSILLPLLSCLLLIACHVAIVHSTNSSNTGLAVITFPFVVFMRMWLDYSSMWEYEFGIVEWKDRNICIPVMHVISKLPDV